MGKVIRTSSFKNGWLVLDRFFVCFFAVFCVGIIVGAVFSGICGYGSDSAIFKIWQQNWSLLKEQSLFSVFVHNILSCITYLLVIYSLGVCAVGGIFLIATALVLGVGKGVFFAFLCLEDGFFKYAHTLIFVLLQNILFCFVILLLVCLAHKMSIQSFSHLAKINYSENRKISFRKYNQWFAIALAALFINCLIDALLMRFY